MKKQIQVTSLNDEKRMQCLRMLSDARRGLFHAVIVESSERLTRDVEAMSMICRSLKLARVDLHSTITGKRRVRDR